MTTHKYFDLTQPNGFPLNQDRLKWMQESYTDALGAISGMIGNNAIVTGCVVTGSNVSDGWVVVNGELLPFLASSVGASIIVATQTTALTFGDGSQKNVQFSKVAKFGTGTGAVAWNSFTRLSSAVNTAKHIADKANPHTVTKTQVGLGSIPNAKSDTPTTDSSDILATSKALATHHNNKANPHAVTKAQVGLGSIPNAKSDTPTTDSSDILATSKALATHHNNKANPHAVTKAQVGLGNLPNAKSDAVNLADTNTLATSKAVNDKLNNLPNAKTDDPTVSDSNILATSKAVAAVASQMHTRLFSFTLPSGQNTVQAVKQVGFDLTNYRVYMTIVNNSDFAIWGSVSQDQTTSLLFNFRRSGDTAVNGNFDVNVLLVKK